MAKQDLSRYQKGIVNRHYEFYDSTSLMKLTETLSDLAVAETDKQREKLWKKAEEWLVKAKAEPARVKKVMEDRKLEALAALVNEMSAKK